MTVAGPELITEPKQAAEESTYNFAAQRDSIRLEVEESFYNLRKAIQDIQTSSRVPTIKSLRCPCLGCRWSGTQREVINNQQDLTRAELHTEAIRDYNTSLAQLRRGLVSMHLSPAAASICPQRSLPPKCRISRLSPHPCLLSARLWLLPAQP